MKTLRSVVILFFTLGISEMSQALAQTVINQVPYTINSSGNYVLGGNLTYNSTGGEAIYVGAPNVTIDFNGYYISNRAAGPDTMALGVDVAGVNNVTLTNGTLSGFNTGIYANAVGNETGGNYGHVFEKMRLINETSTGIALYNSNSSCIIRDCQIIGIGGSGASQAYGIVVNSTGATTEILNNSVATVTGTYAYGIYVANGLAFLKDNHVANAANGFIMTVQCKYLDNLTYGCTTAFSGGTAVGSNN
jgi:hypothetical protein